MNTTAVGRRAELVVCNYLESKGFVVLDKNWRTRWCEIDIVATRGGVVCFCEVKYRASSSCGSGLDYIIPSKIRQMKLAALFWLSKNNWQGDWRLGVAEVSGKQYRLTRLSFDVA